MGATIRDVARAASVGLGTVSRVLNNSPLVSQATRQRVLDVIAELNYTPSRIARNFALGKTLTVATIAPFFTRPSVIERLRGIEATLAGHGYNLVVFNIETPERRESCLHDVPRADRCDGVLIISLAPRGDEVEALLVTGLPVVLIDASVSELPGISIDDVAAGELATRYLLDLGHRRIGFIGDSHEYTATFNFTSSWDRHQGFRHMLRTTAIHPRPEYERFGVYGRFEARVLAREMLQLPEPPTAIFAASDTQALGVLEATRDLGIEVPAMLSIIGFDDIDAAEYLGLTTVRQPLFESGARGAELVLSLIAGATPEPATERLPVEIVVRRSTAPPAKAQS
ncbi:MAG: LacI family transcriptional regulator [Chloroflexales bacterium]|nr:LacI family transcriptional regulator [Chloroflexales bacterium]